MAWGIVPTPPPAQTRQVGLGTTPHWKDANQDEIEAFVGNDCDHIGDMIFDDPPADMAEKLVVRGGQAWLPRLTPR